MAEPPDRAIDAPADLHPAARHFADRLASVLSQLNAPLPHSHERARVTVSGLHGMLRERSPDIGLSVTELRRCLAGQTAPRIDVVYELGRLLDVSPHFFLLGAIRTSAPSVSHRDGVESDHGL